MNETIKLIIFYFKTIFYRARSANCFIRLPGAAYTRKSDTDTAKLSILDGTHLSSEFLFWTLSEHTAIVWVWSQISRDVYKHRVVRKYGIMIIINEFEQFVRAHTGRFRLCNNELFSIGENYYISMAIFLDYYFWSLLLFFVKIVLQTANIKYYYYLRGIYCCYFLVSGLYGVAIVFNIQSCTLSLPTTTSRHWSFYYDNTTCTNRHYPWTSNFLFFL